MLRHHEVSEPFRTLKMLRKHVRDEMFVFPILATNPTFDPEKPDVFLPSVYQKFLVDVFDKVGAIDTLPEHCQYNYAIDLIQQEKGDHGDRSIICPHALTRLQALLV
jgi:hypothetical protein